MEPTKQPTHADLIRVFLNTALEGIQHTFEVAIRIHVKPGQVFMRSKDRSPAGDIAGLIGLTSSHFSGTLMFAFPEKTYLAAMSRMLMIEITELTEDVQDGAAELTNMILGHTKAKLNQDSFGVKQAIPSVLRGSEAILRQNAATPSIIVPYTSELGEFFAELTTRPN